MTHRAGEDAPARSPLAARLLVGVQPVTWAHGFAPASRVAERSPPWARGQPSPPEREASGRVSEDTAPGAFCDPVLLSRPILERCQSPRPLEGSCHGLPRHPRPAWPPHPLSMASLTSARACHAPARSAVPPFRYRNGRYAAPRARASRQCPLVCHQAVPSGRASGRWVGFGLCRPSCSLPRRGRGGGEGCCPSSCSTPWRGKGGASTLFDLMI